MSGYYPPGVTGNEREISGECYAGCPHCAGTCDCQAECGDPENCSGFWLCYACDHSDHGDPDCICHPTGHRDGEDPDRAYDMTRDDEMEE
ncbi:MAG: hypothetical protein FWG25_09190 [Promicromonosporaceae bacterium]|nr:hypothetical protein [Promicromonosporaceae bacterium]